MPELQINTSSYNSFVNSTKNIPLLSVDEEIRLFKLYQETGDSEAGRKIVESHLRFVIYIANTYKGYGFHVSELVQEGCVGLLKAMNRFNLEYDVKFVTYASHAIKAEIHNYAIKNYKIMKVATTSSQRKLFFNLKRVRDHLGWFREGEIEALAKELNVSVKDVKSMETRLLSYDVAFDTDTDTDTDEAAAPASPAEYLTARTDSEPAYVTIDEDFTSKLNASMMHALSELDDRSKDIIVSRWLSEDRATLKQLATRYNISFERIRQIESNVFRKLKRTIAP